MWRSLTALTCLVCLVSSSAAADKLPAANVKKAIEAGEKRRKEEVSRLEKMLASEKSDLQLKKKGRIANTDGLLSEGGRRTFLFRSKEARQESVDLTQAKIDELTVELDEFKTAKHVAPRLAVATMVVGDIGLLEKATVVQIVDELTLIVEVGNTLISVEAPTDGLVDGRDVVIKNPLEVRGTKKYASRTIFHLSPFEFPKD